MIYKLNNGGIIKLQKAGKYYATIPFGTGLLLEDMTKCHPSHVDTTEDADTMIQQLREQTAEYFKQGGILKAQHGILTPWYKAYNSKFGRGVRNLMFGKDYNLSDEEYVQKYGYAKPITGTGMLPGKTSMNVFESIEGPLVKGSFGTGAKYNAGQQIMKTNAVSKTVQPKTVSNWDKFLKKSLDEQNKIVKYWDERYSTMRQLQTNQKQFKRFVNWINKQ